MRKPRQITPDASYHVVARINRKEMFLSSHYTKDLFLNVVSKAKKKYNFSIRNFCIMDNHIHLDITPLKNESLSKIMQWILSVFAIRFNKSRNECGHVWYDRFKSRIIENYLQMLNTFKYIMNNPVRALIAETPLQHKHSGITHIINKNYSVVSPPDIILCKFIEEFLANFDPTEAKQISFIYGFRKNNKL